MERAGQASTVRGGYGTFYDWYDTGLYDQTLRVNGVDQRDLLILNPGYPNPFLSAETVVLPGGRVQAAPDLQMPYIHQASIGVERAITDESADAGLLSDAARARPDALDQHQRARRIRRAARTRQWARSRSSNRPAGRRAIGSP